MSDVREASLEHDSSGLPGGWIGQLLPFVILAAGGAWLRAHWAELPERVPVHWRLDGRIDRYAARTPFSVSFPLVLGGIACAVLLAVALGIRKAAPRGEAMKPSLRLILAGELFAAATCCGAEIAVATKGRWFAATMIFTLLGTLAMLGYTVALLARLRRREPLRNPAAWHSFIYADRDDPALFVPKRYGIGYTINLGHRAAIPLVAVLALLCVAAAVASLMMR